MVSSDRPVSTAREPARVPPARAASSGLNGVSLAGYEIVAELGRGAQSTVYRVRRPLPPEPRGATPPTIGGPRAVEYALKILDRSLADSTSTLIAFRREAALLASVNDPGLPQVHEVGVAEGRPYLVMDLVDGVSLADVLVSGAMAPERVAALALDVVVPLAAVHRRGLVHRDLKPPNIMVLADGEARLIDFGLTSRGGISDTPAAVGTLAYSAPEQSGMLKRPVDNRSDLYSLGVILFEALAGQLPFPITDVGELLRMHAVVPAPDLHRLNPAIPRKLAEVVARLLAKDPDDRYQDGESLAADLRAQIGGAREDAGPGQRGPDTASALSGRSHELAVLTDRWNLARTGHGGVGVLRGAGGIGKSRLAAAAAEQALRAGGTVLQARTSSDDPVPFAPLRGALEEYLQAVGRMAVKERWRERARIRAACAGWSAAMLSRLAPTLESILNGRDNHPIGDGHRPRPMRSASPDPVRANTKGKTARTGQEDEAKEEAAEGQNQFAAAVAGFLIGLAREAGALMLVLDDVQWLDLGTRRVLAHLAPDLAGNPLLILTTVRDDEQSMIGADDFVASMGDAVDVDLVLGPLDEAGVADQIQAIMPGLSVEAHLVTLLNVRSNGNPFVVQEYLRAIVDAGLLRPSWGNWVLDAEGLDALELPQDAVGLVLARVEELGADARALLVSAAAIGNRFRVDTVAAVQGVDHEVVLEALAEAVRRRLVEPRDNGAFAFLHDRIREALLAELDAGMIADLHRQIAEALDAMPVPEGTLLAEYVFTVAYHYMHCAPGVGVDRAIATCWRAGQLALDNHAPAEAVTFLQYAAGLRDHSRSGLLVLLGAAFQQSGRLVEAREQLERALLVETTPLRRAEIFTVLAGVYRASWNIDDAIGAIEAGLAELGAQLPGNRFALWTSTLLMFASAMFRQWTGIGFGSAHGPHREHCQAITALHEVGAYVGVIGMRRELARIHHLRILYWGNQLGFGRRYVLSQASFGLVRGATGAHRVAGRAFARAQADPAAENPAVRAMAAHYQGAAMFLGGADNGQRWVKTTEENGAWLDVASHLDAVSMFNLGACVQGRTQEAEYWLSLGRRRLGAGNGDLTSFISAAPMTYALLGRIGEAGVELHRMKELCNGNTADSLTVVRLIATIFVLVEQAELGAPLDAAIAEFEALKLDPAMMIRAHWTIYHQIAMGRLAQLRAADPATRPGRLLAARRSVEQAERVAGTDERRVTARLVRADLLVLENQPAQALKVLAGVPLFITPDAPGMAFDVARGRARALTALGQEEGRRQARTAVTIATEQRWTHRAMVIATEFGLAPPERGTTSMSVSQAGTYTGGLERQRLQALQEVSAAASRVLDPGELIRIALDETIRILAADRAFLFLTDGDSGGLVSHLGRDSSGHDVPELTGYSTSLVERVRASGQPLVVTGTEEGAALGAESVVLHGLRSILAAPLQLEGRVLGVVYLDSQVAKGIFTADDAGILTALTNHIATSLETARAAQLEISVQTAQRQRDLADTLRQTLQAMSETLDPAEVIKQLLMAVTRVVGCDDVWLLSSAAGQGLLLAADGAGGGLVQSDVTDDPALQALLALEQPWVGTEAGRPPGLAGRLQDVTSWIALPLRSGSSSLGVLVLATRDPQADLAQAVEVAAALAAQGMTAYDKASLFKQVQELAVADELTGIANRRRFFEVAARDLAAAARHGRQLTALMVDIDHFKRVNDTHGHATGDDVIRIVASRLNAQVRMTDILGRYGGEEFALLLVDAGPGNDLPERLRACIADVPMETRSGPIPITVSIGLAYLTKEDGDIATLLARADQALYQAKGEGRNRVCAAPTPPEGSFLTDTGLEQ